MSGGRGRGRSPTVPVRDQEFRCGRGQTIVEYLLMTVMLLFLFTGLYRALQGQLKNAFTRAGVAILTAYY